MKLCPRHRPCSCPHTFLQSCSHFLPHFPFPTPPLQELYLRKLKLKSEYRPRMDWYWVCFEYSLCILMAAAIALQFVYIFGLSPNAPLEMEYPVYDAGE